MATLTLILIQILNSPGQRPQIMPPVSGSAGSRKQGVKEKASPDIQHELVTEASRKRGSYTSHVLERRHRDAAKSLRDREGITVRRADKAAMFVLIPTDEYLSKLDRILADETKFQKLTRDPTLTTVRKANKIIDAVNARVDGLKLQKISGDFRPGYLYGNVKAYKISNPLRPIISQIPTTTCQLAKRLNALLTPLVQADYCYRSSTEFLDCFNSAPAEGEMASLDAESLFTCVPVPRTIDYICICDRVYRSSAHPLLAIDEYHLRELLRICTQGLQMPPWKPVSVEGWSLYGVAFRCPLRQLPHGICREGGVQQDSVADGIW
ncbi:uncharacterized protein LOC143028055 [Oratosquilla oratoria]|uniref:uncharacterized protein LOC143028055 n=1 Tax=Oratosquilla oratoria TaxID=337810 RepID=UPI003F75C8A2